MSTENDPMAEIRASFFIECEELLEALQDSLQIMDDGAEDGETINVVFRAVHSIKGGAGAFGLDALVRFAHRYETVMDEVRTGRMEADVAALKVFFQCADHLSDLVRHSRDGGADPAEQSAALLTRLDALLGEEGGSAEPEPEPEIEFQPTGLTLDLAALDDAPMGDLSDLPDLPPLDRLPDLPALSGVKTYTLHFAPEPELFETGNEPFMLLRALQELGTAHVTCDTSRLPAQKDLIPEQPYLSWTIELETEAEESEILSVFEFVEGLCSLKLTGAGEDAGSSELPDLSPEILPAASPTPEPLKQAEPEPVSPAPPPAPTTPAIAPKAPPAKAAAANTPAAVKSVVRVDLDRIERLVNLVGELVINQAMLSQSLEDANLPPHGDAISGLEEFQRLTRDIQDSVMMIRAQPVKSLFQRMSRIIREASAAVDKDVRLHTEGEATEVDKTVIERLADPLTHMIRNAVDHGLETPADRIAAGKPSEGQVKLTAAHRSGRVIIEVSDDGAGINRPRVLQIAIDKGLIPADSQLSDSEIDNLLFLPGFSTASTVSDLSGRGVGMDVVRTAIQALGGRIAITSTPGKGTIFSISLPLTLAVLDGMVIDTAGETLVVPLNLVVETLTFCAEDVSMIRPGQHVVRVRGAFVPVVDLGAELGYRPPLSNFEGAVALLIAHENGSRAALLIDNILDQRQVVIKGLDDGFFRAPGIAAATILGDGQIALILDPSDIINNAAQPPQERLVGASA
ncbi:chemotaxis protein CheA [Sulfitobacter delicatus]|uniref:Chemotaxis protein CheA n=1 Tax=Sulfitobacter delicatus TaxID=218672 RepID=A0A1G7R5D6_9RHOB|nr:chemotaxis protein CheA [Sulfitobacter delicatus]SDG05943.1 two-component system, chemotaxis family, sensor kinase CheA [Sulfitobacter delicatus]